MAPPLQLADQVGIEGLQIQSGADGGSGQGDSTGAFVWTAGVGNT